MNTDALISLDDLTAIIEDRNRWTEQLNGLLAREPALRIVVNGRRATILHMLKANGINHDQLRAIDDQLQAFAGTTLSLLERAHRRLWDELLPDFSQEIKP